MGPKDLVLIGLAFYRRLADSGRVFIDPVGYSRLDLFGTNMKWWQIHNSYWQVRELVGEKVLADGRTGVKHKGVLGAFVMPVSMRRSKRHGRCLRDQAPEPDLTEQ